MFNDQIINNFLYADDSCVLAPSPAGLQKLLNICSKYAIKHSILYNHKKTFCICFRPKSMGRMKIPKICLDNVSLVFVNSIRYLGIVLHEHSFDTDDMKRHIRYIYSRGNLLTRKFHNCTKEVKCKLFKTFCYSMYGGNLWTNYSKCMFDKVKVAFNNIYRYMFNVKRGESISASMLNNNIDCFSVLLRKYHFSFRKRVFNSCNMYVKTVVNSFYFNHCSSFHNIWNKNLFTFT